MSSPATDLFSVGLIVFLMGLLCLFVCLVRCLFVCCILCPIMSYLPLPPPPPPPPHTQTPPKIENSHVLCHMKKKMLTYSANTTDCKLKRKKAIATARFCTPSKSREIIAGVMRRKHSLSKKPTPDCLFQSSHHGALHRRGWFLLGVLLAKIPNTFKFLLAGQY